MNSGRILIKISRISAWLLLSFMVIFLVSGYAWVNRIIMPIQLARWMHTELDLFLVVFLLIHVLISTKFTLARWRIGHGKVVSVVLVIIGLAAFWMVLLIR
ncbi:MAG: hypothetical protein LUO89_06930 [Methanothrix sp.]|nr:hypothetical protein [Methanothrix sp.]